VFVKLPGQNNARDFLQLLAYCMGIKQHCFLSPTSAKPLAVVLDKCAADRLRKGKIKMVGVTVSVTEEALLALRMAPEGLGNELKLAAAIKLFELGKLSSGAAAALAGIPKPLFLSKLADYGVVTFRLSEEELERDLQNA
jgi:predicted HTH domain antitoxin